MMLLQLSCGALCFERCCLRMFCLVCPSSVGSAGMAGKEGAGRRAAVGRAAGRRRSSRQAQQRARPWSLPSLKRALAEQRRGSAATSSGSFGAKSSSYGSMLLEGEEEEDIEVLETIYANWGDIDQAPDVGEPTSAIRGAAMISDSLSSSQTSIASCQCLFCTYHCEDPFDSCVQSHRGAG